jgi:antibiotic biosynthesis monooxygenase (ABM) superfamily enzyme
MAFHGLVSGRNFPDFHFNICGMTTAPLAMNKPAVLISTARVHPGSEEAFATWQARHSAAISKFPGFISTDMVPPPSGNPEIPWTVIVNFDSETNLTAWKQSAERGKIIGEVVPLVDGGNFGETVSTDGTGAIPGTEVTEVIFSKVRPGMADRYREWAARIQAAQAKYPGYRGMYLQQRREPQSGRATDY